MEDGGGWRIEDRSRWRIVDGGSKLAHELQSFEPLSSILYPLSSILYPPPPSSLFNPHRFFLWVSLTLVTGTA
jgi:hypothetical protein